MNRQDLIKSIADAHYQLADLFTQLAADTPAGHAGAGPVAAVSPAAAPADTFEASPFDSDLPVMQPYAGDAEGSEAVCPKHKLPYSDGKYGPFCKSLSDDPAWTNRKGYCTLTPKNAAQYLRIKAAA